MTLTVCLWGLAIVMQIANFVYALAQMRQPLAPPTWRRSWLYKAFANLLLVYLWGRLLAGSLLAEMWCPLANWGYLTQAMPCAFSCLLFLHNMYMERLWRRGREIIAPPPPAHVRITSSATIVEWDTRAEALFGWQRAEVLGQDIAEVLIPAPDRAAHRERLAALVLRLTWETATVHSLWATALHKDTTVIPVEVTVHPHRLPDGTCLLDAEIRRMISV